MGTAPTSLDERAGDTVVLHGRGPWSTTCGG